MKEECMNTLECVKRMHNQKKISEKKKYKCEDSKEEKAIHEYSALQTECKHTVC